MIKLLKYNTIPTERFDLSYESNVHDKIP